MKFEKNNQEGTGSMGRKYWKSLDEAADTPEFRQWLEREFPVGASEIDGVDRRHFMKIMAASFTLAGLGLSGCRQPKQHILPYSKQPENAIPGLPVYYSTSMPSASGNMPLVVETHSARPTKVEGNPSYAPYGGASEQFSQASVLGLYDPDRTTNSIGANNKQYTKAETIDLIKERFAQYKADAGEGLAFMMDKSTSPSRKRVIDMIKAQLPQAVWVEYEAIDENSFQRAAKKYLDSSAKPLYHFDKAKRVLALDSDFLNIGAHSLAYSRAFASARRVNSVEEAEKMNRLYSAESDFTTTGGMADHRLRVATTEIPRFSALIAAKVFELSGNSSTASALENRIGAHEFDQTWITECAKDLVDHAGQSVVIAGDHLPEEVQVLAAAMNEQLQAVGSTVDYLQTEGSDALSIEELAQKMDSGEITKLVILNGNPVYDTPGGLDMAGHVRRAEDVIRFGYSYDETSKLAALHVAANHYLESWSDGRAYDGTYVPVQPMIEPLFSGIGELEFLLYLAGDDTPDAYKTVKETFDSVSGGENFDEWLAVGILPNSESSKASLSATGAVNSVLNANVFDSNALSKDNLEVRFTQSNQVFDGRYANNGWLQECPDPMTRLAWDNAISISPRLAKELQEATGIQLLTDLSVMNKINQASANANLFKHGQQYSKVAEITLNGKTIKGPINVQPGLANYSIVLPLGYGRSESGRIGTDVGFDAYPLLPGKNLYASAGATLKLYDEEYMLANTQEHWSMEGRAILREGSVEEYKETPDFVNSVGMESHSPPIFGKNQKDPVWKKAAETPRGGSTYEHPDLTGDHQWGMSIDLNTCTGCNSCVIACQSENNIPIVGKDQVLRGREMHWIRMDRYFSDGGMNKSELPEDPQVSFMGMTCQHCETASCEQVCPVNATVHDEEGLNVMAYNRCVGTRYCANNCPYKVRRFNFFDWNKRSIGHFYEGPFGPTETTEMEKMQKNPDVTIRMRGVMEKCTYCVQRIEEAKINQRVAAGGSSDIKVKDGAIKTACQQVCPTESIIFGDISDPDSQVARLKESDRDYSVLGYLNTRPRTTYLAKLRNPNPAMPGTYDRPLSREEYETRYGHDSYHSDHTHENHETIHNETLHS